MSVRDLPRTNFSAVVRERFEVLDLFAEIVRL